MGNSLAHLEAARGTVGEEDAKAMLRDVLEREVGESRLTLVLVVYFCTGIHDVGYS